MEDQHAGDCDVVLPASRPWEFPLSRTEKTWRLLQLFETEIENREQEAAFLREENAKLRSSLSKGGKPCLNNASRRSSRSSFGSVSRRGGRLSLSLIEDGGLAALGAPASWSVADSSEEEDDIPSSGDEAAEEDRFLLKLPKLQPPQCTEQASRGVKPLLPGLSLGRLSELTSVAESHAESSSRGPEETPESPPCGTPCHGLADGAGKGQLATPRVFSIRTPPSTTPRGPRVLSLSSPSMALAASAAAATPRARTTPRAACQTPRTLTATPRAMGTTPRGSRLVSLASPAAHLGAASPSCTSAASPQQTASVVAPAASPRTFPSAATAGTPRIAPVGCFGLGRANSEVPSEHIAMATQTGFDHQTRESKSVETQTESPDPEDESSSDSASEDEVFRTASATVEETSSDSASEDEVFRTAASANDLQDAADDASSTSLKLPSTDSGKPEASGGAADSADSSPQWLRWAKAKRIGLDVPHGVASIGSKAKAVVADARGAAAGVAGAAVGAAGAAGKVVGRAKRSLVQVADSAAGGADAFELLLARLVDGDTTAVELNVLDKHGRSKGVVACRVPEASPEAAAVESPAGMEASSSTTSAADT
eukprot:TRINITY_DN2158_c0_g1_i1.p1 TRINITY_DN2158_c0_g1~~TRINITY_DN2158_c0_g1_i1.p1  ORF type:complete len:599 (-),score=99.36 TRINITY_DN2158_c0_g1_i1:298-2094(-)